MVSFSQTFFVDFCHDNIYLSFKPCYEITNSQHDDDVCVFTGFSRLREVHDFDVHVIFAVRMLGIFNHQDKTSTLSKLCIIFFSSIRTVQLRPFSITHEHIVNFLVFITLYYNFEQMYEVFASPDNDAAFSFFRDAE